MNTHIAPCGHRGECIIGTYVRCLQGCDSKTSVRAPVSTVPDKTREYLPIKVNGFKIWMLAEHDFDFSTGFSQYDCLVVRPAGPLAVQSYLNEETKVGVIQRPGSGKYRKGDLVSVSVFDGTVLRQYSDGVRMKFTWDVN